MIYTDKTSYEYLAAVSRAEYRLLAETGLVFSRVFEDHHWFVAPKNGRPEVHITPEGVEILASHAPDQWQAQMVLTMMRMSGAM